MKRTEAETNKEKVVESIAAVLVDILKATDSVPRQILQGGYSRCIAWKKLAGDWRKKAMGGGESLSGEAGSIPC